ncbi:ACT domain-containing protein [uncultured Arcticibacterium sp.]|uniref:ACT domain-containing protein n=1 Tax=uncultured Arcticibacterium sp. TaxID=2173042 RepID=UPI0030FC9D95
MAKNSIESLIENMSPEYNSGDFVFVSVQSLSGIDIDDVLALFRESEGISLVLTKVKAEELNLNYDGVFSWITLKVFSDLNDVGFTAAFSNALAGEGISCNVIAGVNHDHIFVLKYDTNAAMKILSNLSEKGI